MPDTCCVTGCTNRRNKCKIPYYRIPLCNKVQRKLWIKAIDKTGYTEKQLVNLRVCAAHFVSGKKSQNPSNPDYIPSIFPSKFLQSRDKRNSKGSDNTVISLDIGNPGCTTIIPTVGTKAVQVLNIPFVKKDEQGLFSSYKDIELRKQQIVSISPVEVKSKANLAVSQVKTKEENTTSEHIDKEGEKLKLEKSNLSAIQVNKEEEEKEMASNYVPSKPSPENVQLAFNPAVPAAAQGSPHYIAPQQPAPQISRPTPPPVEQKVRQGGGSQPPPGHGHVSYQSKYGELLNVIEDLGREIKPTYAGSKMAQERLKKGIMHARALVRECLAEVEKSARQ